MEIFYALGGLLVGGLLAWWWGGQQLRQAQQTAEVNLANAKLAAQLAADRHLAEQLQPLLAEKEALAQKAALLEKTTTEGRHELLRLRQEILDVATQLAQARTQVQHLSGQLAEKEEEYAQMQQKLTAEFKNIAADILEEKSKRFTEQNQTNLFAVLAPLQQKFAEFKQKVEEVYDKEAQQRFSLEREIKSLHELNQQMSREAQNLTSALRGQTKTQGNWGEFILESVLEKSGLVRGREYLVQASQTSADGRRLQPDVVIGLPGQKYLVVDSKVSLTAYERWHAAEHPDEKDRQLRLLAQSVRQHVADLAAKGYHQLYGQASPDFVLMFLPVEPAFALATQQDPDLFQWALDRNIVLVSASTLLATLRTVASLWRQEKQTRNAEDIAREGGLLYDKVHGLLLDLQALGEQLGRAQSTYDTAVAKVSTGKGNLLARVERLKVLGAKTSKTLPLPFDGQEEE
ncbi:MAG: DNA recombination protein RmuC [Bernardetiaceae bacterium]|jgi:DNA recombination protein RmuC|nr:DNA recombination protein RmuC [Bernardetiaceae bacterium]